MHNVYTYVGLEWQKDLHKRTVRHRDFDIDEIELAEFTSYRQMSEGEDELIRRVKNERDNLVRQYGEGRIGNVINWKAGGAGESLPQYYWKFFKEGQPFLGRLYMVKRKKGGVPNRIRTKAKLE